MESRKSEFLKTVCQIYMVSVLVVLPLYYIPWNGYYKLGDSKYYLFRNISIICMSLSLTAVLIDAVSRHFAVKTVKGQDKDKPNKGKISRICRNKEHSVMVAVCAYGLCAVLSALCSPYGSTAWTGEREWYMGAVTICIMMGGFLLAANFAEQCRLVLLLGEAAFAIVTLLGLLQKLGLDPLGMLKGYVVGDWEYTHMLSTLGNNNWLGGYYSVMFPVSLAFFYHAVMQEKKLSEFLFGMCNVLALMLLLLQGSDGGVLVAAAALWISFWFTRKEGKFWGALLIMLATTAVGMRFFAEEMKFLDIYDIMLQDGIAKKAAAWRGWLPTAAILVLFCGVHHLLSEEKNKILRRTTMYLSLSIAAICVIWYLYHVSGTDFAEWGNRRGMLWQMAWRGFREGNLRQKLLGAGPDCFAAYLGKLWPGGTVLFDKGYFAGSIFTNAHNEWLTTLVNMGVVGTAAYAAVFVNAFRKYKKNFLAVVMLFVYGIHSMISFQQVLNAPLFFLILGVCEAEKRAAYKTDRSAKDKR